MDRKQPKQTDKPKSAKTNPENRWYRIGRASIQNASLRNYMNRGRTTVQYRVGRKTMSG